MKKVIAIIISVLLSLSIMHKLNSMSLFSSTYKGLIIFLACWIFLFFILNSSIYNKTIRLISDYKSLIQVPLVLGFFAMILFSCLAKSKFDVSLEKREPNPKPNLILEDGNLNTQVFRQYEAWSNDSFGGRHWFIDKYGYINYNYFGSSNTKDAIVGKNDWLFYSRVGDGNPVSKYQNNILFTEEELKKILKNQELYFDKLKQNNIDYVLSIAPNKATIYDEHYPDTILKVSEISKADQVIEYLKKHSDIKIVYAKKELIQNKPKAELYFKADTHWNNYGAFICYQELIKSLSIKPMELADFNISEVRTKTGDLLGIGNIKPEYYKGESIDYEFNPKQDYNYTKATLENGWFTTQIQDDSLPRAIIYRDSFFSAMQPFFSNHFSFVEYRHHKQLKKTDLDNIIEQKPDLVVFEFVERYIDTLLEE